MHRIRRCALALMIALSCVLPARAAANASEDPLLDFVKVVAPEAVPETPKEPDPIRELIETLPAQPEERTTPDTRKDDLSKQISKTWRQPETVVDEILSAVEKYAHPVFPTKRDILAIISVESGFNPKAYSQKNVGLMQINLPANGRKLRNRSIDENIRVGVDLLREYFGLLDGNKRATILSYNAGIGNYKKGRYNSQYWVKFKRALSLFP